MIISLIAAIGKNNELGKGNDLVWKMPADQKYFRDKTLGHPVIMGRKTFESLGKSPSGELGRPLPSRRNIIITRDKSYLRLGIDVVHSLEEAVKKVSTSPQPSPYKGEGEEKVYIIGGADIYRQAINTVATHLDITEISAEDKTADVFFPAIDKNIWKETWRENHQPDDKNPLPYSFVVYEKK
ncbi:MAG: dihydrofolate reductase [Patescibacteria group bacterium]